MRPAATRPFRSLVAVLFIAALAASAATAHAAVITYTCTLSGAAEAPPNASPGTGTALVEVDAVAHTLHLNVVFSGLTGITTASHIHAPTAVAGTGTASVATTTPYFSGFPIGVTAGVYDIVLNTLSATSYNASYVTANGGLAGAEAALFAALAAGKAYLNIHSQTFGGGEIRGFPVPAATPTTRTTWSRIQALYR